MEDANPSISVVAFKANGLNTSIKRQWLLGWKKTQDVAMCYLQETQFRFKDTNRFFKMEKDTLYKQKPLES